MTGGTIAVFSLTYPLSQPGDVFDLKRLNLALDSVAGYQYLGATGRRSTTQTVAACCVYLVCFLEQPGFHSVKTRKHRQSFGTCRHVVRQSFSASFANGLGEFRTPKSMVNNRHLITTLRNLEYYLVSKAGGVNACRLGESRVALLVDGIRRAPGLCCVGYNTFSFFYQQFLVCGLTSNVVHGPRGPADSDGVNLGGGPQAEV